MDEIRTITLWQHFRQRPSMYMGKRSIFGLQCFLHGVQMTAACGHYDKYKETFPDFLWEEFEEWLSKKKNVSRMKSFNIALNEANDDEKAFDLWMDWYAEFENELKSKETSGDN